MTNLDSIFKSRDMTLSTKVHLVKAMVFPVVMYGCDSWTVKKAESRRIDAFELWCWRRLLRVPWTARMSNQSILKEISPGCFLEEMMLKLKLKYFGHLMRRVDSLEKTLMLGGIGGRKKGDERGWDGWMGSPTRWDVSLSELWELLMDREAWRSAIHGVTKSWIWLSDWTELNLHYGLRISIVWFWSYIYKMFYDLTYSLSWRKFHIYLKKMHTLYLVWNILYVSIRSNCVIVLCVQFFLFAVDLLFLLFAIKGGLSFSSILYLSQFSNFDLYVLVLCYCMHLQSLLMLYFLEWHFHHFKMSSKYAVTTLS